MSLGDSVLQSIDWSEFEVQIGTGTDLAEALSRFIGCDDPASMHDLWRGLESSHAMFAQDTVYRLAEPAVDVLLAALVDDRPRFVKMWSLEALRMTLKAGSSTDPELPERCRRRARRGVWLLVAMSRTEAAAGALEVLELIDPVMAKLVRSDSAFYLKFDTVSGPVHRCYLVSVDDGQRCTVAVEPPIRTPAGSTGSAVVFSHRAIDFLTRVGEEWRLDLGDRSQHDVWISPAGLPGAFEGRVTARPEDALP